MKKFLTVFLILNITTLLFADPDFRNVNWGDSLESVRNAEKAVSLPVNSTPVADFLRYEVSVAFKKAILVYVFFDNKLTAASYAFDKYYPLNSQRYILDFEDAELLLNKKYGDSEDVRIIWLNESSSFKDDKSSWGFAIIYGSLELKTTWETSETQIEHKIGGFGGTYEGNHMIIYRSQKLFYLYRQAESEGL